MFDNRQEEINQSSHDPKLVDIVIVGAGPIGLLNAIGLLNKDPSQKIVILEKHETYTRDQPIHLNANKLKAYLRAIDKTDNDPALHILIKMASKNKSIPTSRIEQILRDRAIFLGAEIITGKEITDVKADIFDVYSNANLILGADGTHSKISDDLFDKENKEVIELGYNLQLRFKVDGDAKKIKKADLIQFMQGYGIACSESVSEKDDNGQSAVTLNIVIDRNHYEELEAFNSKNAIKIFGDNKNAASIPPVILKQIKGYLGLRLREFTPPGQMIDLTKATVNVHKTPAVVRKNVYKRIDEQTGKARNIVLVGDAALGLSFFKGLNSGIEASAELLTMIFANPDKDKEKSENALSNNLNQYNHWFIDKYKPQKLKENQKINKSIRFKKNMLGFLKNILGAGFFLRRSQAEQSIDLYLSYISTLERDEKDRLLSPDNNWTPYPHRKYKDKSVFHFSLQPREMSYFLTKNLKNFKNSISPYKTFYDVLKDFKMPFRAAYHLSVGTLQTFFSFPIGIIKSAFSLLLPSTKMTRLEKMKRDLSVAAHHQVEGLSRVLYGLSLALTSIAMPVRILSRGLTTIVSLFKKDALLIEKDSSITSLVRKANEVSAEKEDPSSTAKIFALCTDIHRKYDKYHVREHKTLIPKQDEEALFKKCLSFEPPAFDKYLSLFGGGSSLKRSSNHESYEEENLISHSREL